MTRVQVLLLIGLFLSIFAIWSMATSDTHPRRRVAEPSEPTKQEQMLHVCHTLTTRVEAIGNIPAKCLPLLDGLLFDYTGYPEPVRKRYAYQAFQAASAAEWRSLFRQVQAERVIFKYGSLLSQQRYELIP